jgi:hypothetical protein
MRSILRLLAVVAMTVSLSAVDYQLANNPDRIRPVRTGHLLCEWPPQAEYQEEDPQAIRNSVDNASLFFDQVWVIKAMENFASRSAGVSAELTEVFSAREEVHYQTAPQTTTLESLTAERVVAGPVPIGLRSLQREHLSRFSLVFYNDGDPWQRRWLVDWAERAGYQQWTIVAAAWENRASLDQFRRAHPALSIMSLGDEFAKSEGITHLPAVMSFPEGTSMTITYGYDRDAIAQRERQRERADRAADAAALDDHTGGVEPLPPPVPMAQPATRTHP